LPSPTLVHLLPLCGKPGVQRGRDRLGLVLANSSAALGVQVLGLSRAWDTGCGTFPRLLASRCSSNAGAWMSACSEHRLLLDVLNRHEADYRPSNFNAICALIAAFSTQAFLGGLVASHACTQAKYSSGQAPSSILRADRPPSLEE
jgi:hypothetical protein